MTGHGDTASAERVPVRTERRVLPRVAALGAHLALTARFGRDQVYLLESAGGPGRDTRYEFAGFGVLLTVTVRRGDLRVEGVPALRERMLARLVPLLDRDPASGRLRIRGRRGLLPVLRAAGEAFDAAGSASRFRFGFLGHFGYDAGRYVEDLPWRIERCSGLPDVQLVLYQGCVVTDIAAGESELLVHQSAVWPRLDAGEIAALLARAGASAPPVPDSADLPEAAIEDDTRRADYLDKVRAGLRHIAAGDIYQVQLGHELAVRSSASPLSVYLRLRERNPSPYMYLTTIAGHTVIGASPELFVRVEDGTATMRPIAGTIPRGSGDDERAAGALRADPKERAEHTMLVDLCRNDLGRICRPDALAVPDHCVVERYSHVLHLVSTVSGRVAEGRDGFDVIAALFPAGTMTGAPKIRAMEVIEELEHSRRGLYAGALGLVDVGGYVNLALCIRTLIHHEGVFRIRASAGVVADSVAEKEWTETLAKMAAAYWAVTGREILPPAGPPARVATVRRS